MSSHRIRLAGPWEWQAVAEGEQVSDVREPQTCRLPFPAGLGSPVSGGILLRRGFHRPTGIAAGTSVVIVVEVVNCVPEVWLNGQILSCTSGNGAAGMPQPWRFDVSELMKSFNELRVRLMPAGSDSQPSLHAAALEIREQP